MRTAGGRSPAPALPPFTLENSMTSRAIAVPLAVLFARIVLEGVAPAPAVPPSAFLLPGGPPPGSVLGPPRPGREARGAARGHRASQVSGGGRPEAGAPPGLSGAARAEFPAGTAVVPRAGLEAGAAGLLDSLASGAAPPGPPAPCRREEPPRSTASRSPRSSSPPRSLPRPRARRAGASPSIACTASPIRPPSAARRWEGSAGCATGPPISL